MKIIPSVLTGNKEEAEKLLKQVVGVKTVSIDMIDGEFAQNRTITPKDVDISRHNFSFDAQLMVVNHHMERYTDESIAADFTRIIGHVEGIEHLDTFIGKVSHAGKIPGIGIDLPTPVVVDTHVLSKVGVVLVMSVKAGFGGQRFEDEALEKVRVLKEIKDRNNFGFQIHVDGGVTPENIILITQAGADEVSVGRRLFNGDFASMMKKYKKALV